MIFPLTSFFRLSFFVPLVGLSLGCAQLQKWSDGLSETSPRRSFQVRVDWVKPGPAKLNLGYRKINRFSPVFFEHPQHGPVVIQGNSIDGVVAYSRTNGQEIWRRPIVNGVEASAILQGDRLFFGAMDGMFYSVSALDGSVIWSFPTRVENIAEPLYADGLVYFLTGANTVFALDAESGKQVWLYSRQDPQAISIRGGSKPALSNGNLYIGFSDGALVSLNAKTGALKWEKNLNRNKRFRDLDSAVKLDGEVLYVSGFDDAFYALRAATGDVAWRHPQGGYGEILMTPDRIFYASTDSELVALNRSNGAKVWGVTLKTGLPTAPSLSRGLLAFGESQGSLRWVDAGTGKEVARYNTGTGIMAQPRIEEKTAHVFLISTEGNVYSIAAAWKPAPLTPYLAAPQYSTP